MFLVLHHVMIRIYTITMIYAIYLLVAITLLGNWPISSLLAKLGESIHSRLTQPRTFEESVRRFHKIGLTVAVLGVAVVIAAPIGIILIEIRGGPKHLIPFFFGMMAVAYVGRQLWIWLLFLFKFNFNLPSIGAITSIWSADAAKTNRPFKVPREHVLAYVVNFLTVSLLFIVFWLVFKTSVFLYFSFFMGLLAIKRLLRISRPPAIAFFAVSSKQTSILLFFVKKIFLPLEIGSLLIDTLADRPFPDYTSFRREENPDLKSDWKDSVRTLMSVCPIIIIDTRKITPAVSAEIDIAMSLPSTHKIFMIGHPSFHVLPKNVTAVSPEELLTKLAEIRRSVLPARFIKENQGYL